MEHQIKAATAGDRDSILALLPRLAEFKIPKHRAPRELWQGDAKMVKQWADGERDELDVWVALSAHCEVPLSEALEESLPPKASEGLADSDSVQKATPTDTATLISSDTGTPTGSATGLPSGSDARAVKVEPAAESEPSRGKVVGVSIVSYKPELLNDKPSAHLEVMVVDKSVEGQGVASALMKHAQKMAASNGAHSMSLHVFAANENARTFYDKHGFDGELLRYSKPLKVRKIHNFFGKHVASSGVARSIKKLLRTS